MTEDSNLNQNPDFYSEEYYLKHCSGHENFEPGKLSERPIFTKIKNLAGDLSNKSILDLGCGRGDLTISLYQKDISEVVGVDFSKASIKICHEFLEKMPSEYQSKVEFVHENALTMNLGKKFDIIILADIVEHLYDEQLVDLFRNVKNHLNEDGIVIVHTMPTLYFLKYGQILKKIFYFLRGKKYRIESLEDQAKITHVNLQTKSKFLKVINGFEGDIWYGFAYDSFLRRLVSKTFLIKILSGNLWAKLRLSK